MLDLTRFMALDKVCGLQQKYEKKDLIYLPAA
jgi:hypothetical protein